MQKIKVTFKDRVYEVTPLTSVLDFISEHHVKVDHPVAIVLNGHFTRLNRKLRVDSTIEFIELKSPQGRRIYESSLSFLFLAAFKKEYPDLTCFIQHSLHMGLYVEIQERTLNNHDIAKVKERMQKMVIADMPIERVTDEWDVAMDYFNQSGRQEVVNLFKYQRPGVFTMYELDGFKDTFYMPLLPSAGMLSHFDLIPYEHGLLIMIPDLSQGTKSPTFVNKPKLFKTFQEYNHWSRILKVRTVGHLNNYIMDGEISDLIKIAESFHEKRVAQIADAITSRAHVPKLVCIAGPTSSGKTTFSKRLGIQLRVNGFRPVAISMDNYFVSRAQTPRDEDGNYDFEVPEALDLPLFAEHMTKLLRGEEIELPRFDFKVGDKTGSGEFLKLDPDQIIIIEGIHGLNPKITSAIDPKDKFKIYIAPLTQINLHQHDRVAGSDTRLLRRIVRDRKFRGYSASDTLSRWNSVRRGEKRNIFPLQEEADEIFNSALFYELSVLKNHAERELLRVEKSDPMYSEAQRLLKFLSYFLSLDAGETPSTSILKEFIGGSTFKY